jgi:chromate transporter
VTEGRPPLLPFVGLAAFLGIAGFGGGYAIAQRVKRAVVDERKWIDEESWIEILSVSTSLPGTTTANLFAVLGYRFGGMLAATAAVLAFLAPSVALMVAFGVAYDRLRDLGAAGRVLDGMSVATAGVVAAVAVDMRATAIKGRVAWAIAIASALALGSRALNLLEVFALAGITGAIALRPRGGPTEDLPPNSLRGVAVPFATLPLGGLFFVFARIGIATFGGGIAMIAPMEHQVVTVHQWLTAQTFADAIVLGQITPGPVAISATFVGWRVAGPLGALAATLGIFGPPFVLALLAARSLRIFRTNPGLRGFLAGVAPAVVGAIAAAAFSLAQSAVHTWWEALVASACFALLVFRPTLTPIVPIAAAGVIELAVRSM